MTRIWIFVLLFVALVGGRLLGERLGWWRAIVVAWLGLATGGIAVSALTRPEGGRPSLPLVVGVGILGMMAWAGLVELVAPRRAGPRRGPVNPLAALRGRVARARRYTEISLIVARSGLLPRGWRPAAAPRAVPVGRALRVALEEAGGVYVKLGQFLSTRPDVVSPDVAAELRLLQQDASPMAAESATRVLGEELGADPTALFAEFDAEPVAAASIAQVHKAVLPDGRAVAVKIQRPDVAERVRRDLDILARVAVRLERRTQWAQDMRLSDTVAGFAESVTGELDFQAEARNLVALGAAVHGHDRFTVPAPVDAMTRRRVLVMDWVEGTPLTHAASTLDAHDRHQLARTVLRGFLDQLLVAGIFHADPHPGNLYLTAAGRIALLDCGSVGRLDRRQRTALQTLLLAIDAQDPAQLADALTKLTATHADIDRRLLERALGALLAHQLGPGATPGVPLLTALMELTRDFRLALEPVIGGALRALALLQTTFELIAPDLDLIDEVKAYGHDLFQELWQPTSAVAQAPRDELKALLPTLLPLLLTLPRRLDRITEAIENNETVVGVRLFPHEHDRNIARALLAELIIVAAGASLGVTGALLILASTRRVESDTGDVLQALGIGCVAVALAVLLRTLLASLRHLRRPP